MKIHYKKIRISKHEVRDEHRLIMEKAIGRRLLFNEIVHHIDGNKLNNNIDNLELMSRADHIMHHMINGDIKIAPKSKEGIIRLVIANSSVTEQQAIEIKYSKEKNKFLSEKFNVSKFVVSRIKTGKSWAHI